MKQVKDKKLTVVLVGGGTGGHIYPAISVAQKLKTDEQIGRICYVGCPYNMERDIAANENLEFWPISISGMPRKKSLALVKWYIELNAATQKSLGYLLRIKPDVVLGTGGYVSGPVLLAATILRIPFLIHDPDAHPGIVNRFMAPFAKAVSISFEDAKKYLNSKNIILNGNPIRSDFSKVDRNKALKDLSLSSEKKTLIVMGGSQGAQSINNAVLNSVQKLVVENSIQVIHQTGKKNYEEYIEKLEQVWPDYSNYCYIPRPYFDNMPEILAISDIAVSRAGSMSISELNIIGLPSILVPYPYAAADHQRFNAKSMEKQSASIYLEDAECNAENLIRIISDLFTNPQKLEQMKLKNLQIAKPEATDNLVGILKEAAIK